MKQRWLFMAILIVTTLLVVASCSLTTGGSSNQELSGRILLWHALNTDETESLNQVIDSFSALYPDVNVKVQVFSTTVELNQQFITSADAGLGPDLLLTPSSTVPTLMSTYRLAAIDEHLTDAVRARFNPAILATLQFDGQTYGLPQSLDTLGLFVNRQLVETPATDLSTLLEQANTGTNVLVPINFNDAYWGIRAFGGQLFSETGQSVLDQGGFANWLAWLRDARSAPGMIQDTNRDLLRQRFMAGNDGYYFGYASELNQILTSLDAESIEVYPLPSGPVGQAGPLVTSQAFLFSNVSSDNQQLIATELAKFVTNVEQSSRLMRLARQVPANINVRINPRLYPMVASFVSQARNGIPKPLRPEFETAIRLGNEAYVRALEGGESPAEVAFAINNSINTANGYEAQATPSYTCQNLGTLRLLDAWQDAEESEALNGIIEEFHEVCPLVIVESPAASLNQVLSALRTPLGARSDALVGLVDQRQLPVLIDSSPGLLTLGNAISNEVLQRFAPIAVDAMRREGNLYGLPLTMNTDALYFNREMVNTPAQTLDDLRAQAASGIPITLDTSFETAFWGLRAYGTQLFAPNGAVTLGQGGAIEWLTWLRESRDSFGIQLSSDRDEIRSRFLNGESAYYVGGSDELSELESVLGGDLAVTFLPSGPGGPAQPLVSVDGLVIRADATGVAQSLVLDFMRYVTDVRSQTVLMEEGHKIPTNGSISTTGNEFFGVFFEQAQTGFLLPSSGPAQQLLELGDAAYTDVLTLGEDPAEVVNALSAAINEEFGLEVTPTPTPEPTAPPEESAEEAASDGAATGESGAVGDETAAE